MSYLSGPETKLLMRILERCVQDCRNPKWRQINLAKAGNKLSDTSLVILQQAGFQRTETHMILPMTEMHTKRAAAVYGACLESISFSPGEATRGENGVSEGKASSFRPIASSSSSTPMLQSSRTRHGLDIKEDRSANKRMLSERKDCPPHRPSETTETKKEWSRMMMPPPASRPPSHSRQAYKGTGNQRSSNLITRQDGKGEKSIQKRRTQAEKPLSQEITDMETD
eukprot:CAMPEP_0114513754 /NCGR_PEP_ID=MMETSP0109-20121206/15764_1 /TAXON_ID=29199 /ORGANISM="Chlorarachnion reptans, Strain CCCM449" /LENGTH=225 /DNA_ID=CAMNT_0001693699 /DNA_START=162 /DNA_END=839 /DNA_ORIENTATION=+